LDETEPAGQRYEEKKLALIAYVRRSAAAVAETGEPRQLRAMSVFERRVAHETAQAVGVSTSTVLLASKQRRVLLVPVIPVDR
jgi:predicted RNA-binding protein Jag